MDNLLFVYLLLSAFLWGCDQSHSGSMKVDAFTNYINSNAESHEVTNQQSNSIVNVAF